MKARIETLVADIDTLRMHVRDTGEVKYYAIQKEAADIAVDVEAAMAAPLVASQAMKDASIAALGNMPEGSATGDVIDAILSAALSAARD